jgi:hypothetical protein
MEFFRLPIGHVEWHIDRRDPHPPRIALESLPRRRNRRRPR